MKQLLRSLKAAGIFAIAALLGQPVAHAATPARFLNISARTWSGPGDKVLIVGFVLDADNTVMLRGVGPTLGLSPINLPGTIQDPVLTLYRNGQSGSIGSNDDWDGSVSSQLTAQRVGALPLALGSKDSMMVVRLPRGAYTAHLSGKNGGTGIGMIEAYIVPDSDSAPGFLNLSIRSWSAPGNDIAIAGIVVDGQEPFEALVRCVGPTLLAYGVTSAHPGPSLTVFNNKGAVVGSPVTGWQPPLSALMAELGAAALPPGSADSATSVMLPPGSYTVHGGSQTASGVVLLEIYKRKRL